MPSLPTEEDIMTDERGSLPARLAPLAIALLGLALFGAGCSAVLTVEPIGSDPVALDPPEWDGVWCDVGSAAAHLSGTRIDQRLCLTLTVVDPGGGTLAVRDPTSTESHSTAIVRRLPGTDVTFLTVPYPPDADGHAFWVRIHMSNDVLLYWEPRPDAFRALVETGALSGTSDGDVVLFPLDANELALIGEQEASLFQWQEPRVLVRLRP